MFMAALNACPAETAAELFFKNVTKYFGVPQNIVSERDTRFTGRFWTVFFNMLGTELKFSTANHPQTDGQTERVNALLEDYIRHYVAASQQNWMDLLDVAQFSYNLHKSSATGMSPFELVYGQQPRTPHEVPVQKMGSKSPAAYQLARNKQELFDEANDSLYRGSSVVEVDPADLEEIRTKYVHRGLIPKYDGPFQVVSKVGSLAYRLKLPDRLKIHPMFHQACASGCRMVPACGGIVLVSQAGKVGRGRLWRAGRHARRSTNACRSWQQRATLADQSSYNRVVTKQFKTVVG
ncbi:UNVERIFIED_CONTAM: Transposon Ty3-I Gag-Pol polyprotein [Sesamum radiatum]|uniref:Transposon Ty3-I Gag-Pol polyprotein n=1 Tax=Sesamum radiatum TaxID=300843 RepID=A0AAW2LP99_SESRA